MRLLKFSLFIIAFELTMMSLPFCNECIYYTDALTRKHCRIKILVDYLVVDDNLISHFRTVKQKTVCMRGVHLASERVLSFDLGKKKCS